MLRRLASALIGGTCRGSVARSALETSTSSSLPTVDAAVASCSGSSFPFQEFAAGAHSLLFRRTKYTYRFKQQKDTPGLIYWRPATPGTRHRISIDYDALGVYTGPPVPALSMHVPRTGGRDHTGRIRTRGRGGGEQRVVRLVDYDRRDLDGVPGVVQRVEADPNRSGFLALTRYDHGGMLPVYRYHVAPIGLKPGDRVLSGDGAPVEPGCVLRLRDIPVGQHVFSLELRPGGGGTLVRAAHTCATIIVKKEQGAVVKLPSGEHRMFDLDCRATIGRVSNHLQKLTCMGKAGANRNRGRRPKVRGIAMNPVDHPHGGRGNGGRPSCTPWGVYCKGKRTRRRNKASNKFILLRKGGQPIGKFQNAKKVALRDAWKGEAAAGAGAKGGGKKG